MFCDYTKIEYQDHSEYLNLPTSEELRRRALEAFDSEFVLQLGQERQRSAATASQAVALNSTEVDKLNELKKNGIIKLSLSAQKRNELNNLLTQRMSELVKKREASDVQDLGVETASIQLGRKKNDETDVFHFLRKELRDNGVLAIASAYLERKMSLKFLNLQINESTDGGIKKYSTFSSGNVSDCYYMHIDSAVRNLKLIMYLNDVETARGAFRYILGSHKWMTPLEKCIRRANDRAGLDALDKEAMTLFYNLPSCFQMKANFGNDLICEFENIGKSLVNMENALEGRDGDMLMFDNSGVHRGAIFEKPGKRKILQIVLS
jgi:hypothetical protein